MALNQQLYRALQRRFGRVLVQKEGEAMNFTTSQDLITKKMRATVRPGCGGEDYKVSCPFCNDTRFRMEVSHRWNTTDELSGCYFGAAFMRCYNDGCDANVDAPFKRRLECHEELVEMLKAYVARGRGLITKAAAESGEIKPAELPDVCMPLDSLDATHPAVRYLEQVRQFNIEELSRDWRVMYCPTDPNPQVSGRVIIPIYHNEILVGWQARYIENNGVPPSKSVPKYYTMPRTPKSRIMYNYDRAKYQPFGVIVEGVMDAWRVGIHGVAVLGSSLSLSQVQLSRLAWTNHGLVLMYDPEFIKAAPKRPGDQPPYLKIRSRLSDPTAFKHGVLEVVLPDGTDPGSFQSAVLWEHIRQAAVRAGFPLEGS